MGVHHRTIFDVMCSEMYTLLLTMMDLRGMRSDYVVILSCNVM